MAEEPKDEEVKEEEPEEVEEPEDEVVEEVKTFLDKKVDGKLSEIKQETEEELEDKIDEYLEEQKEAIEKKAGIYHEDVQASRKAMSEKVRKHVKLALGDVKEEKAQTISSDPYGGYTVDDELDAEIRALIEEYGAAREHMFVTPLEKNAYRVNRLVSDVAVGWLDEGEAFESDAVELGQNELSLKKLGVIVALSNELLQDTEADLTRFITERVANQFAYHEDRAAFVGDGTDSDGGFNGILYEADNVHQLDAGDTSFTDITIDDVLDARDLLTHDNLDIEVYMSRDMKSELRKSKDSNNAYHFDPQTGLESIWGMPINVVSVMPGSSDDGAGEEFILIGDLEKATIMGTKGGFVIDEFNTGTVRATDYTSTGDFEDDYVNLLTSDKRGIRFKERVGFVNVLTDAVAVVQTGPTS